MLFSKIPSLERREGWREGWKDKQMERRQKKEAADRKRLLFLSADEKKEGLRGARDNREHGGEEKKEGCD